jgi:hypothetical protein
MIYPFNVMWWLAILMNPKSWRGPWQSYPQWNEDSRLERVPEDWIIVRDVKVHRSSA